jgi:hypothetical protein
MIVGCFGGVTLNSTQSKAASIYFAGKYKHTKYALSLKMIEYSSPEGKRVGGFELKPGARVYLAVDGELYKVGKNKYQYKEGKSIFTFKVYKKKVIVKMNKTAKKNYLDYSGTYKLKKRYPKP